MLLEVVLPLSLAFIMFSLGLGLTFADFGRVLSMPVPVLVGLVLQIIGVPLVALAVLQVVSLPPALAFGVMILSFCPGGVTSNVLTRLSGGTVALSITLTAVASLLSVLTVPWFTALASTHFLGDAGPEIDVSSLAIAMAAITVVPVLIGLLLNRFLPGFVGRVGHLAEKLAMVLFVIIVIAAIATNWAVLMENLASLGPVVVGMNALFLILGVVVALVLGLSGGDGRAITVELGVQNATLGIAVAAIIAGSGTLSGYALPSAVYGIGMYIVTIPAIWVLRRVMPS